MEDRQVLVILGVLVLSLLALLIPAVIYVIYRVTAKPADRSKKRLGVSRILVFSGCLLCSVWCLRYAVGYYSILTAQTGEITLTWWEEILNSLVHALQTFSMDEDYTDYILTGKAMVATLLGEGSGWVTTYGVFAAVLNFIAPVAGGAIIFEILASIFPKLRLNLYHLLFWKEKYYFSELNGGALALARSICAANNKPGHRPVIIFTDVYTDSDEEQESEILQDAKLLGAICMKDDLAHVRKNRFGKRKFFLIDEAEEGNLQALVDLSNPGNGKYLKKAEVFVFTDDDTYNQVEKQVLKKLQREPIGLKKEQLPILMPVKRYWNMISSLLSDIPLYEPMIEKKQDDREGKKLTVSILGAGSIGTEMFLTTYWIGQMLDCKLRINMISKEPKSEFWDRIDYISPEIRRTIRLLDESGDADTTWKPDPLLRINRKGDFAPVYAEVCYYPYDVRSTKFISMLTDTDGTLWDTDYFLVSLGSDEENISVANTLKTYMGEHHIKHYAPERQEDQREVQPPAAVRHTVIAYVVYNDELSDILNQEQFFTSCGEAPDIFMHAFGSLQEVYSVKNVFLLEHDDDSRNAHANYDPIGGGRVSRAKKQASRIRDCYSYMSSMAQTLHLKYKAFSAGMIQKSLFSCVLDAKLDVEVYAYIWEESRKQYEAFCTRVTNEDHLTILHRLAWLEHRRWNAHMRTMGFRNTTDYEKYAISGNSKSYKKMELKIHPCIVECDQGGIKAGLDWETGRVSRKDSKGNLLTDEEFTEREKKQLQKWEREELDLLDEVSLTCLEGGYSGYDFKRYDYPACQFPENNKKLPKLRVSVAIGAGPGCDIPIPEQGSEDVADPADAESQPEEMQA